MTIFRGELQLLRWSETSNAGATVTFQLADVRDLEAFKDLTLAKKGMAGQRIAAIMVQAEDDVEQQKQPEPTQRPGMLCIMACTFCADPEFQNWCDVVSEAGAKQRILALCSIGSRKELDSDPIAAQLFHSLIRTPFMKWKESAA